MAGKSGNAPATLLRVARMAVLVAFAVPAAACGSGDKSLFGSSSAPTAGASGAGGAGPDAGGVSLLGSGGVVDAGHLTAPDSAVPVDAGPYVDPNACNMDGLYATLVSVPVTWPRTAVLLEPGEGELLQWTLTRRTRVSGTHFFEEGQACGITIPDLTSRLFVAVEQYRVNFPPEAFDQGQVQRFGFEADSDSLLPGTNFVTSEFSLLLGHAMADTRIPWPTNASGIFPLDPDADQRPGLTMIAMVGGGYSAPPVSALTQPRADLVYVATRSVQRLEGVLHGCDELRGVARLTTIDGKVSMDSRIVGCHVLGGGECNAQQARFIDENQPVFSAADTGKMTSLRVPDGSTCWDARNRLSTHTW